MSPTPFIHRVYPDDPQTPEDFERVRAAQLKIDRLLKEDADTVTNLDEDTQWASSIFNRGIYRSGNMKAEEIIWEVQCALENRGLPPEDVTRIADIVWTRYQIIREAVREKVAIHSEIMARSSE